MNEIRSNFHIGQSRLSYVRTDIQAVSTVGYTTTMKNYFMSQFFLFFFVATSSILDVSQFVKML